MSNRDQPDDLDRRRSDLERALAARKPERQDAGEGAKTSSLAGMGNAMRLSSEFIAGVLGGALFGWVLDKFAGTGPWGLIVFLLLGFAAGITAPMAAAGTDRFRRTRRRRLPARVLPPRPPCDLQRSLSHLFKPL